MTFKNIGVCYSTSPMYQLDLISRWNIVKTALKQRYAVLTDDDLAFRMGKEADLMSRLQAKLKKSRADIMRMIGDVG